MLSPPNPDGVGIEFDGILPKGDEPENCVEPRRLVDMVPANCVESRRRADMGIVVFSTVDCVESR